MDIKIILTIIATVIGVVAFLPYLRDVFTLKTKPHAYTWLIWSLTQGTAAFGLWYGGGGWGGLNLVVGWFFITAIFIFSLKYGTKNITSSDTTTLIAALAAILVWWQLDQPLLSVLMVSAIDIIGYIPTFRKSYENPWSETLISWAMFVISNIFAMLALNEYNLLTMSYLVAITLANISLFYLCYWRRKFVLASDKN